MNQLEPLSRVKIIFDLDIDPDLREDIIKNLSGVALSHQGKYLWLGTDEFTAIERFTRQENGEFAEHKRFYFQDFIEKFDESKGEVDVEGLDYHDGYLWIIGSHSSKRKKVKVKANKFHIEDEELKKIERQENRYLLARIPINEFGLLDAESPKRGWLKRDGSRNALTQALAKDEYLDLKQLVEDDDSDALPGKEFYGYLPSKENGLDIEGLAALGNKVLIGLRGPVLRGIAILLEIEVEDRSSHELELKKIGNKSRKYKRHFLDLDGLGIRELCFEEHTENLLILAGPTMDLDGSHALFRLENPFALDDNSLSSQKNRQLTLLGEIAHGDRCDRAEGLTLYEDAKSILVVYDSPAKERLMIDREMVMGVYADILSLA
ncbi:MAG: DUF3616 domain-containing protein [Thermosynechococcaceae cyanobacterium]